MEELPHAPYFWVIKISKKKNIHFSGDFLIFQDYILALMIDMFLKSVDLIALIKLIFSHFDINEWHNPWLKFIFGSFYNNDELLTCLGSNFKSDLFLKLLGNRIFDEPAIELNFWVLDLWFVFVIKWQFHPVILPEDGITIVELLFGYAHCNNLVIGAYISKEQSWTKNFTANKLTIVYYIGIHIKNFRNLNQLILFLLLSFYWLLMSFIRCKKWFRLFRFLLLFWSLRS